MRTRVAATAMAAIMMLTGCTVTSRESAAPGATLPPLDELTLASALVPFDACDDLLGYVTGHALEMAGPYGLGHGGYVIDSVEDDVAESPALDAAAAPMPVDGGPEVQAGGTDFSRTNVQEVGVDEPDLVKTDGSMLYVADEGTLFVVDVTQAQPRLVSETSLPGEAWGHELLLAGDRLLVLATTHGAIPVDIRGGMDGDFAPRGGPFASLTLYDVADPADPREVATLALDGWVVSARMTGEVARVVTRSEPVGLPWATPEGSGLQAEREATDRNRAVIRESTAENWVPYYVHTSADGRQREGMLVGCEDVSHPPAFSGLGMLTVSSVDLAGDLVPEGNATGVLAHGETVYASESRLYVATSRWIDPLASPPPTARGGSFTSELHAFDITDERQATYVASGTVRGHLLSQWAMSDHDGYLRVATTDGRPMLPIEGSDEPTSESYVTVFAERGRELVEVGQVGGLGPDERIFAVRFMGDVGYVVTFREVDPLYTLDLSNPAQPRAVGELKILGYSAYLHPVGEGLLLGVGQDADETGRIHGTQLSLFDVSDPADPQRLHQYTLSGGSSPVEWDHRAFLHWPATGLTMIPYELWRPVPEPTADGEPEEPRGVEVGALGLTADRAAGFTEVGRVTHLPADAAPEDPRVWEMAWSATIRRSIVVGDRLLTVSGLGVKASDLDSLADVAWLRLPDRNR